MRLSITDHAADRYIERVKPWLTRDEAREEIRRLSTHVEATPECEYVEENEAFDAYMELAPGITLGCRADGPTKLSAVTTMIRTGENQSSRARRRHEKQVRRQRSQAQKRREQLARRHGVAKRQGDEEWRNE